MREGPAADRPGGCSEQRPLELPYQLGGVAELRWRALLVRLVSGHAPVDALATDMGTSVAMIERHSSHLTPRMAARELE